MFAVLEQIPDWMISVGVIVLGMAAGMITLLWFAYKDYYHNLVRTMEGESLDYNAHGFIIIPKQDPPSTNK